MAFAVGDPALKTVPPPRMSKKNQKLVSGIVLEKISNCHELLFW